MGRSKQAGGGGKLLSIDLSYILYKPIQTFLKYKLSYILILRIH